MRLEGAYQKLILISDTLFVYHPYTHSILDIPIIGINPMVYSDIPPLCILDIPIIGINPMVYSDIPPLCILDIPIICINPMVYLKKSKQ